MSAGLTVCWVARFVLAAVSQYLAGTAALAMLAALRTPIFAHVQALSVRYFDGPRRGGSSPHGPRRPTASSRW